MPAPTVEMSSIQASIAKQPMGFSLIGGREPVSMQPAVTFAHASQKTETLQANNVITLVFQVNVRLRSTPSLQDTSSILVSGLTGSMTASTPALPLSGPNAYCFNDTATWNASAGELLLRLGWGQVIDINSRIEITVVLGNPDKVQAGQQVVVSGVLGKLVVDGVVTGETTEILGLTAAGDHLLRSSLVPTFDLKIIGEDNNVDAAVNTISLTLSANVPLEQGFTITVTGLLSATEFPLIPLLGPDAQALGGNATYNYDQGTLVMTIAQRIMAHEQTVVIFRVQNNVCTGGCAIPQMTISARGEQREPFLSIAPSLILNPGNILQAGNILRFKKKTVLQSSLVAGALTIITYTLQPNAPLFGGTEITVTGMRGTQPRPCSACATSTEVAFFHKKSLEAKQAYKISSESGTNAEKLEKKAEADEALLDELAVSDRVPGLGCVPAESLDEVSALFNGV